jgi:hypothetical protein
MRFEQYDDAVYAHTDYLKWLDKYGEDTAESWLGDRRARYGDNAFVPSAIAWRFAKLDAVDTDILWMTPEMMDLVQTAMETFDPEEPMDMDDIFIPKGFLVLPHPFYSLDINGGRLAWRVLYWNVVDPMITYIDDTHFNYDPNADGIRKEPGVRFIQASHIDDPDDFYEEEMMSRLKELNHNWGIAHATSIPQSAMSNQKEMSGEGDHNGAWLTFWRVMQKLMAERIVLWDERQPGRAARREAQRFLYPPSVLRVIELRRPRKTRSEDDEQGEGQAAREYSHRWIVRGHWRNQACGPNHSLRKQRWISAYEKGPEDLDLVIKTRVWNWDR